MKRIVFLFAAAALLAGCQTTRVKPDPTVLRVGVSANSQPMIFKQGGQIVGIEADFAQKLGKALNRLKGKDIPIASLHRGEPQEAAKRNVWHRGPGFWLSRRVLTHDEFASSI